MTLYRGTRFPATKVTQIADNYRPVYAGAMQIADIFSQGGTAVPGADQWARPGADRIVL